MALRHAGVALSGLRRAVVPAWHGSVPARSFAANAASGAAPGASTSKQAGGQAEAPKLVVFGGRGFVGSAVCQEALTRGLQVLVISRAGTPPPVREPWVQQVAYVRGDALDPRTYEHHLEGAAAAVSCVGGFGSQEQMRRVNGSANVAAIAAAKAAGVPRFALVSATIPNIPGLDVAAKGYVEGKRMAEDALFQDFPNTGVALRPAIIYGDRVVSAHTTVPLGAFFKPIEMLVKNIPNARQLANMPIIGAAVLPPVSVEAVARAAVRAATDSSVPGGIIDVWQLSSGDFA